MESCKSCSFNPWEAIKLFYENEEAATDFLRAHGVLPTEVECPECKSTCSFYKSGRRWVCGKTVVKNKKKRSKCTFVVSDFRGTFLENAHLPAWKIVLFVNHWFEKSFDHDSVISCLKVSENTCVNWSNHCSKVADFWLVHQNPIGGPEKVVEIDLYSFEKKRNKNNTELKTSIFGGLERGSKNIFVVPLTEGEGIKTESDYFLELIKKYILPETTIITRSSSTFPSLTDHGYYHLQITTKSFVDPVNKDIHIQNITRLWKDLKEWIFRPGMRHQYLKYYISRYMFTHSVELSEEQLHKFFEEAGKMYPHSYGRDSIIPDTIKVEDK